MKLSRFKAIYNGLNGTAKKVYEAVPISSHWSQHKIMRELERLGKHLEPKAVQGCLGYMVSVGIVEENRERDFMRTPIKLSSSEPDDTPYTEPTEEEIKMAVNPQIPAPPPQANNTSNSPVFTTLSKLGERAQKIADMLDDLKEDIEKLALQAQADHEANAEQLAKFQQFKQLMALMKE